MPGQTRRTSAGGAPTNHLNFHQLFIFQTVANHLSFSRAADALEITQPAVSIQVQELEKSLGITLFHRRPRGLRITEAGEAVLSYSQQIFALSSRLVETVQEMENLQSGHLVLGASTTPGEYVLPIVVGRFRQIYPGIHVELVIGNTRTIIQRTGTFVPRIHVGAQHEIVVGILTARDLTNDVRAFRWTGDLGCQIHSHRHRLAALQHVLKKNRVWRRQSRGRYLSYAVDIPVAAAGMRVTMVVGADRANDNRLGTTLRGGDMPAAACFRALTVGGHS